MADEVEVRVARILDSARVVLNRGAKDGVEIGTRFAILSTETVPVHDPVHPEIVITSLPVARTIVKVVSVTEYASIAQTFRTLKSSGALPKIFGPYERTDSILSIGLTAAEEVGQGERVVKEGDVAVVVPGSSDFPGVLLSF